MSKNIFLISDTHFGHFGVCKFMRKDGVTKLRPWDNPDDMDEAMVERWNAVVRPHDKVYHLGDVAIKKPGLETLARLNGDKVLIRGNHDIFDLKEYTKYFRDVRGCHVLDGMILTHIPLHTECLGRFGTNIHGHTHEHRMRIGEDVDPRYHSVCVEQINYTPIAFEDVKLKIVAEGGAVGFQNGNMYTQAT